jgi:hypothetical protein
MLSDKSAETQTDVQVYFHVFHAAVLMKLMRCGSRQIGTIGFQLGGHSLRVCAWTRAFFRRIADEIHLILGILDQHLEAPLTSLIKNIPGLFAAKNGPTWFCPIFFPVPPKKVVNLQLKWLIMMNNPKKVVSTWNKIRFHMDFHIDFP